MPDYLRPDADDTDGGWTDQSGGTTLFDKVDETSASDSDFIRSSSNPSNDACKLRLSNPGSAPQQPMKVRYRYKKVGTDTIDLQVRLLQGATEIAAWSHDDITTSYVDGEQTLTSPQFSAISDFNDLYIELTANPGVVYSDEAQQFFDRISDPGTTRKNLYADAIDALVSAGIWAKLDALYLFAAPDSSTALTNLKSSSFGITAVSAPDFTADRGFNSDDGTGYLDTGFNPTSGSPHFTQNSACVFAWNRTNPGSVAPADAIGYVSGAAGLRIYVNFSGQTYFACNSNSSSNESSPSTTIALFSVNRTDSSNSQLYRNGTDVDDFPETSSAPNNENIVFLKGESGIANSAWELSAGGIGSSLNSTEQGELYDALLPYLQAVGAV